MATPILTPSNISFQIIPASAGGFRTNVFDADGAALDVSTGFAVSELNIDVSSASNPLKSAADIKANMTFAYDETGIDASWTAAQASTIAALLPSLQCNIAMLISNDSGTTKGLAAQGSLSLNPAPYLS
jgi:hypothetical protein